eukprot:7628688-Alexandrium_andersonii.AAC.1
MCEHQGELYLRAAQGHSVVAGQYLNWDLVLNVLSPGSEEWIDAGVHGTNVPALVSMLREGMFAAFSKGPRRPVPSPLRTRH